MYILKIIAWLKKCFHYRARAEALKRLAWFLSNEHDSNEKLPIFASLDVTNLTSIFIIEPQRSLDEDLGRSVFQVWILFSFTYKYNYLSILHWLNFFFCKFFQIGRKLLFWFDNQISSQIKEFRIFFPLSISKYTVRKRGAMWILDFI